MSRRLSWTIAVTAVLLGVVLRLHHIAQQILLDDEWHALHAIARFGYARIATRFGFTDVCIPMALWDKVLADTVGLGEIGVRLPALLAGLLALVLLPALVRRELGGGVAVSFACLLAGAPLHVFFTRFARPYAITLLLTWVGALALAAWWTGGRRGWRWLAVACLAAAPWFHLAVLPAVAAALVIVLAAGPWRGARPRAEVLRGGVWVAALVVLAVGVPLALDHSALSYKAARGHISGATVSGALELLTGTARPGVVVALLVTAIAGLAIVARRRPHLALVLAATGAASPLAVALARPVAIDLPIVLARYCLFLLPLLLVGVATSLDAIEERTRLPRGILAAAAAVALFLAGPLPRTMAAPSNWTNHGSFQFAYDPSRLSWSCPAEVPEFYRQLGQQPAGSMRILEAPWWHQWDNVDHPCYQAVHRQWMAIGFVAGPGGAMSRGNGLPRAAELPVLAAHPAYRFRNFVHVFDAAALRRGGFRYVVFHPRLAEEMRVDSTDYQDADVGRWIAYYRTLYGPPAYEDAWITVFDVTRTKGLNAE